MKPYVSSHYFLKSVRSRIKNPPLWAFTIIGVFLLSADPVRGQTNATFLEPFRPQFHFSPARNWMNDPNGLLDYQGEHHLFFQYNPFGITWGPTISWGHAVSTDWVHWKELPVAIPATDTVSIFSGSAVVDERNSSGFGDSRHPPLVAIYCVDYRSDSTDPKDGSVIPAGTQAEDIAFSTDRGRTWTPYAFNPVINPLKDPSIDSVNFRDPKVFWYEPAKEWVMVVALSSQHQIRFYSSPDLKNWTHLSDFGPANAVDGVWECPDFFQLPLASDGQKGAPQKEGKGVTNALAQKWVLVVNVNPGAVAGGSGAQYFIGEFDGKQFTADNLIDPGTPPPGTLFQNFESATTFAALGWTTTRDFVGKGPVNETGPTGFLGRQLVDTFFGSDASEGTATSAPFRVSSKYINLLVGGGDHPHHPNTSDGAEPVGVLLFRGADLEPGIPGATTYEQLGWTATGDLVNQPVATGPIGGQQPISNFEGQGFIDTFVAGSDGAEGTLTSPVFTIAKPYINFLIGGGNHPYPGNNDATAVLLVVNGRVVDSTTGQNNEALNWVSFEVRRYIGQAAQIEVIDQNTSGWGHVNADDFLASDSPAIPLTTETTVDLVIDGKIVRSANGQNSGRLTWTAWDVAEFAGQNAQIEIIDKNNGQQGWGHLLVDDIYFSDVAKEQANWIDWGRDFYAVNSWNHLPSNQRRWIGWMNNWDYGGSIPTSPWRSAQSIPRDVALQKTNGNAQLIQTPITELRALRGGVSSLQNRLINAGTNALGIKGKSLEIIADFQVGTASEFGLKVRTGHGQETVVGYDAGEIFVDRTKSGQSSFSELFPSRESAPYRAENGRVKLHLFVDWSSVEVFGGQGEACITDQIFPSSTSDGLALFAIGGTAKLVSLQVWPLRSIWEQK